MKNFLPALAGVLAIAFAQPILAQTATPCDQKGIFTDPAMPAVNPEYSPRTNTFNWYLGQQNSGMAWTLNNVAINEPNIQLPWWQTDNAQITHLQGKLDFPKDGWELMKRDFGYNDAGNPVTSSRNPYVILYNKRTGMLRVFTAIGDLFGSYQFAEIKLLFNGNGSGHKSATLNRMEGLGTALLDTPTGLSQEFVSIAPFLSQRTKWFMADFPMEYDPCACQFDSKLNIEVRLISQADVRETSTTTGTLVTASSANPGATQTSSDFDKAFAMGKKVAGNISAGQKTYKTLDSWASGVKKTLGIVGTVSSTADADKKKSAIDALKAAMQGSNFLKNGLSALPYLGFAVSAFDAFFGGGKEESGPQPVALQPMTIEMNTVTTGTITATTLYSNPTFNNPGTRAITTALDYPYYNEAMGVFSLIKRPVVEVQTTSTRASDGSVNRVINYHPAEDLQYVINPASGLEVQDFQVALMQEGYRYPAALSSDWDYEGLVPASGANVHAVRTGYVNSGCLTNQVFTLDIADINHGFNPTARPIYLKFILNLRPRVASPTTQNVLVVLKYPVTVRNVTAIVVDATHPCLDVQPQQSAAEVQAVCAGSVYQAAVTLARPNTPSPTATLTSAAAAIAEVSVFPNPATDRATVSFAGTVAGRASAYVTDMFGNRVLTILQNETVATGEQRKSFDTSSLRPGLYQCVMETPDGKRTSKRFSVAR